MTLSFRRSKFGYRIVGPVSEMPVGSVVAVPRAGSETPVLKKILRHSANFTVEDEVWAYANFGNDICQTCREAEIQTGEEAGGLCRWCIAEAAGLIG